MPRRQVPPSPASTDPDGFYDPKAAPPPEKRPVGRPTLYTEELAAQILELMSEGKLVTEICRMDGMPARTTLHRWTEERPDFGTAYARARVFQAEAVGEQAFLTGRDGQGDAARVRVAMDAGRWLASRINPEKWEGRQKLEHSGPDGGPMGVTLYQMPGNGRGDLPDDDLPNDGGDPI